MTDDLNKLRYRLWDTLRQTCDNLTQHREHFFSEIGVSAQQCMILIDIVDLGRTPTITELAKLINRNVNSTSAIVDRMVRHGLVKRNKSRNGKASQVLLTTAGKNVAYQAKKRKTKLIGKVLGQLSPEELQCCLDSMKIMVEELSSMSNERKKRTKDLIKRKRERSHK
ncbi:MAG: MarR family transcriptional regulator [Dehalococcoidia bacterium]